MPCKMQCKFKVGDYFIYENDVGRGFKVIGCITAIGEMGKWGTIHYKLLKDVNATTNVKGFSDFCVGSDVYNRSRIVKEREAMLEVL